MKQVVRAMLGDDRKPWAKCSHCWFSEDAWTETLIWPCAAHREFRRESFGMVTICVVSFGLFVWLVAGAVLLLR